MNIHLSTHPINREEFVFVKKNGKRVFSNIGKISRFKEIFSRRISRKSLVYRCPHFPEKTLLKALADIALKTGDKGIYMSCLSAEPKICNEEGEFENWYISLDDIFAIENDPTHPISVTTFSYGAAQFYSPQGLWGLITGYDYFGVVGGSDEVFKQIYHWLPDLDAQVFDFLEEMTRYELKTFWLYDLLTHVYGRKKCRELMQAYNFPEDKMR